MLNFIVENNTSKQFLTSVVLMGRVGGPESVVGLPATLVALQGKRVWKMSRREGRETPLMFSA